jgi:hypothetical protein
MVAGCDPIAHEEVTLQLPSAPATNAAKSAVELINEVMATNGFTSGSTSVHSNESIIAGFDGPGQSACFVYHRSNEIQVVINEMGRFRSRPEAIKARDELKRRLSEKFGKDRVSQ